MCFGHLHSWMLSKEGKTAKRLYGVSSQEPPEKRKIQESSLMRLFLSQQETWMCANTTAIVL